MKPINAPLPVPEVTTEPVQIQEPPADRAELLALLTRITQEAKMPPSVKQTRFVRLPAELYTAAHSIVRRELANLASIHE